jgi:regulator of cell morphogenesis and NO signaling
MEIKDKTIGGIVAEDFRTAAVFKKYGIDFCCKGNRSIEEVCAVKKKNPEDIYADLERVTQNATQNIDFKTWDLDLLSDYIEKTHHRYVEEKTVYLQ